MQFASKCVVFLILSDKKHLYFCLPFPLIFHGIRRQIQYLGILGNKCLYLKKSAEQMQSRHSHFGELECKYGATDQGNKYLNFRCGEQRKIR